MLWGSIQEQPKQYQVLKTNIKLYVKLVPSVAEELVKLNTPIGITLVCDDLGGKEYHFRQGIEVQKVQVKKNMASFKVLINPITKLKRESLYNTSLPLSPEARKAKPRFWLRIFWGTYPPMDTCKFYLFIRRDEQRSHEIEMVHSINNDSSKDEAEDVGDVSGDYVEKESVDVSDDESVNIPLFSSSEIEGAFKRYPKKSSSAEDSVTMLEDYACLPPKPCIFKPIVITPDVISLLRKHEMTFISLKKNEKLTFLELCQKPDAVQICTQVLKPHITLKVDKQSYSHYLRDGIIDVELIWSYKLDNDEWKTVVVPNGVYYETSKTFTLDEDAIVFKHVHVNNWTLIKNYVRDNIPKTQWKDSILKANYGLRFNVRSNAPISTYVGNVEIPFLFHIDIRRENDPNYVSKGKRSINHSLEPNKRVSLDKGINKSLCT